MGVLVAAVLLFGLMIVVPPLGHWVGLALVAVTLLVPLALLLLSLRRGDVPGFDAFGATVMAASYFVLAVYGTIRRGPDWRYGIVLAGGLAWLVLAGVRKSRGR